MFWNFTDMAWLAVRNPGILPPVCGQLAVQSLKHFLFPDYPQTKLVSGPGDPEPVLCSLVNWLEGYQDMAGKCLKEEKKNQFISTFLVNTKGPQNFYMEFHSKGSRLVNFFFNIYTISNIDNLQRNVYTGIILSTLYFSKKQKLK